MRKELYERAVKMRSNIGVDNLLIAIDEAAAEMKFAISNLEISMSLVAVHEAAGNYNVVTSLVENARNYEVAAGKFNTLFLTLECVVNKIGVIA